MGCKGSKSAVSEPVKQPAGATLLKEPEIKAEKLKEKEAATPATTATKDDDIRARLSSALDAALASGELATAVSLLEPAKTSGELATAEVCTASTSAVASNEDMAGQGSLSDMASQDNPATEKVAVDAALDQDPALSKEIAEEAGVIAEISPSGNPGGCMHFCCKAEKKTELVVP